MNVDAIGRRVGLIFALSVVTTVIVMPWVHH